MMLMHNPANALGRYYPQIRSPVARASKVFFTPPENDDEGLQKNYELEARTAKDSAQTALRDLGMDHEGTLMALNDYAVALGNLDNHLVEAENLLKATLGRARVLLGPQHPYTETVKTNYVNILNKGAPLKKRRYELDRQLLGEEHEDTVAAYKLYRETIFEIGSLSQFGIR
jgi:hypothetical protein